MDSWHGTPVWITPALTEASKSVEVVKMESDTMGGTTIRRQIGREA